MASEAQLALVIKGDVSDVVNKLNQVEKETSGLGKTLETVGKVAAGFLAANVVAGAGQKLMGFVGDSIAAASDLGESINAVNQIFGESAKTILDWGKETANSYGLSQRAFNQMATPMGAVLKNLGFSQDEVATSTINLTKRAADMASVFNTSVPEALEAINSALRGEANPIERYGVSVNAAAVEARALAMTGKESASALTDQEKAAARLAIIFEQTDAVAGDFANTSDQLANKTRIQQARMEELQATIGTKLLPIQLKITEAKMAMVEVLATYVIPKLEELYAKHWPAVSKAIGDVVAFIETTWPKVQPIFAFVADYVKTQIEGMIQIIQGVVAVVDGVIDLVSALAHGEWAAAWDAFVQILGGVLDIIEGNIKRVFGNLPGLVVELANALAREGYEAGKRLADSIVNGIGNLAGRVADKLSVAGVSLGDVGRFIGVPGFDSGGVVPGPIGAPRLIMAHGGETILPTHKGGMAGAGVNVYIQGPVYARDRDEAARAAGDIGWALQMRGAAI